MLKIDPKTTAREIVDAINEWANVPLGSSRLFPLPSERQAEEERARRYKEILRLWDVLTAMRGPDTGSNLIKRLTTKILRWPLRHLAYNAGALVHHMDPVSGKGFTKAIEETDYRTIPSTAPNKRPIHVDTHFADHVSTAARVLDLMYPELSVVTAQVQGEE